MQRLPCLCFFVTLPIHCVNFGEQLRKSIFMKTIFNKSLFFIGIAACFLPFVSPAIALFIGLLLGFTVGNPYIKQSSKASKYLLQFAVVGLGFGMNLYESLQSGKDGMLFTVFSVVGVLVLGYWLGRRMLIDTKTAYLISSGTAICGGSAIAAVAPILKATPNQMSVSLGTIYFSTNWTTPRTDTRAIWIMGSHCHSRHELCSWCWCSLWSKSTGSSHHGEAYPSTLDNPFINCHHILFQTKRRQSENTLVYSLLYFGYGSQHHFQST